MLWALCVTARMMCCHLQHAAARSFRYVCAHPMHAGDFAERGAEYVYKAAGIAQPSDSDAGLGRYFWLHRLAGLHTVHGGLLQQQAVKAGPCKSTMVAKAPCGHDHVVAPLSCHRNRETHLHHLCRGAQHTSDQQECAYWTAVRRLCWLAFVQSMA